MTPWLLIPLLAFAALFQVTLMPVIPGIGFKLDLPLLLVVTWGIVAPVGEAAQWGFIVGFFLDLASGLPFGTHMLTLTMIGLLLSFGQTAFFRGNLLAPPIAMILATLVNHLMILGILTLTGQTINWNDYLLHVTLITAILNALAMPITFFPLQRLQRILHPRLDL